MQKLSRRRALSFVLTIFMLISTFGVFPVSVGASEAATPEPLVWNFTAKPTQTTQLSQNDLDVYESGIGVFNDNLNYSGNTVNTTGKNTYNDVDKCLDLLYTPAASLGGISSYYRCTFRPQGTAPTSQAYMVIKYRTDAPTINSVVPKLYLAGWNNEGNQLIEDDASVSGGKWVCSEPVILNDALFNRIKSNHCTLHLTYNDSSVTTPTDISFQIKEIAFFATEEEANEYALDPLIYDFTGTPTKTTDFGTNARDDFDSGVAIYNKTTTNVTSCGYYEHDTENDAAVMDYYTNYSGSVKNIHHRFTFRPISAATAPTAKRPYMVVLYKTNAETINGVTPKLYFSGWNSSEGYVLLEGNMSEANGEWMYSDPVHVEDENVGYSGSGNSAFMRFNSSSHCLLQMAYNDSSVTVPEDTIVAIKEIAFFASEAQANAYISYMTSPDIILSVEAPESVSAGQTFDANIEASTKKSEAQELSSANFTLTYSSELTLNSISMADGIGGEGIANGNAYGWYFDGENGVEVTADAPVVIAKASFTAPATVTDALTAEIGFDDNGLNVALVTDAYQIGFKPDVVKGSTVVEMRAYKLTVPAGMTASVNAGTPVTGDGTTTVDVSVGDTVVLTPDDDIMVKSLTYKFGTGTPESLTAVNGTYTIPTDSLNGDITVEYTVYDYSFIEADEYMALAADQKVLVLPVTTAGVNDTTYTLGGTYNKSLYYSSRYDAYVAIVDADATAGALGAVLTATAAPAEAVKYTGDVNRDGRITAGDAALVSAMLHSCTNDSKASDTPAVTDIMRLEADVCGKYVFGGAYVTVVDSTWVLFTSVGLTFDAPEEQVKIEGIIIPTTTYSVANEKLDIYTIDTCPTDHSNSYGANVGKYEFDPLEEAFSLKHANNTYMGSNFKFHLILDKSVSTTVTDESWMVMTYRTNYNGATTAQIKLANNLNTEDIVTLADDISVSGGEYVFSTPVNINNTAIEGNLFTRLKNRTHSALIVTMPNDTNDEETYFFIKEIAFFESENMAKAYIENTELPEANTDTYTKFTLYDMETTKPNLYVFNNDYISTGDSHSYNDDRPGQVGEYRFHDDQQALEILEAVSHIGGDYHKFHFQTKAKNVIRETEKYMVILYRTNVTTPGAIRLNNNSWSDVVTLDADLTKSADKWVFSTPADLDVHKDPDTTKNRANLFGRVRGSTPSPILVDIPRKTEAAYAADQYFFLKEILFFSSLEAANRYIANVPVPEATEVVYGNGLSKDQWIDPVAISLESAEKTTLNASASGDFTYTDDGAKLTGTLNVQFNSEGYLLNNHVLVALSYKSTAAGTITLGDNVIAADTSVSEGEWVYTDAFALTDEIKAAFESGTPNSITYTGDGDLYIGEIVFISNSAQLETYVSEFDTAATGTYYDGKLGKFTEITVLDGTDLGDWSYAPETAFTLEETAVKYDSSYRMTYQFANRCELLDKAITVKPVNEKNLLYFYMRAAYKADNGSADDVQLITVNPKTSISVILESDVQNTDGEWVLSDPVRVPNDILNALSGTGAYDNGDYEELNHLPAVLAFTNTESDASYAVKNIYFFKTAEDAINFTMPDDEEELTSTYTVGGTTYSSVTPVSAVDTSLLENAYKIYVDGTSLKVSAGSEAALEFADKVALMRVLGGDMYEDVVTITLASDFALTGTLPTGEASDPVDLKYDDRYTFDKAVAYVESANITSTDAITGETDVSVLKRIEGETFAASAIGEGTVYFTDGTSVDVKVCAAPLNVILLGGQSNTEGVSGSFETSIRNTPGQVYSTYAPAGYRYVSWMLGTDFEKNVGSDALTIYNNDVFVPKSLTTTESRVGSQITYTLDSLNEGGHGKGGIDGALAYEWNRQTGEKVWVINAAHSGSTISSWQPGSSETDNNFWQAVGLMKSAEETLKAEISAGHYTMSHMGFFWLQGCSDISKTTVYYADAFNTMFEGFCEELAFDHDDNSDTDDKTLEFAGIILVRRGGDDINNKPTDYYMNGPRTAQYTLGNTAGNDIYLVGNVGDYWRTDDDVTNYFVNKYVTNDNFKAINNVTYNMPTTVNAVHPDIHYRQVGYNEIARDAVHNLLRQKGIVEAEEAAITFNLLDELGVVTDFVTEGVTLASGASVKIVPDAAPRYLAGVVSVTTSANITHDGYYTFTSTNGGEGTITFTCGDTSVTVNVN